ncbi:4-hydroxythreonine-4-phosphate dehydrogenase PdxA [Candidatus Desantisbacteria bacterium CG_4_10_14_0_8_um_filter_48_22]|uniref:4-hydroxythreonine-4-phosphate dehydrogenase PdxA n=1 Tax=Candidatus Desantisbacteria bacterium CG_4_10_14_0_8_um_filter_48_22 TaxID=1974543 RepID=A0A2M7SEA7_9BACT|nr:MAG: 4-hydroxythreonine-4-phosphate dehydrogenase PdxA [Candidatus Desantisbacteria bacterium CG1_02_49_89]PIZ17811.1 MAG: 4-hydroxythreonine-4-phosphate dehydrogenase PdxA [Candidatus Desantisbacteria bacterium CG_4_10_14_0_8_um_filter_48_22]PJB28443.1 MAG: 4-hydroxythreonine-4-phosphate dehydrogenase PdxA [Candidatus Desantisbacteria bacterium CG_4_9_14_3_um_filter_50_7]
MKKQVVGITMGDSTGIGPEVIAKSLLEKSIYKVCSPLVIGDPEVMKDAFRIIKKRASINTVKKPEQAEFNYGCIDILFFPEWRMETIVKGQINLSSARASVGYIKEATNLVMKRQIDAIVTGPINKEAVRKAGFYFDGHTELLAQLTNTRKYAMMFVGGGLYVVLLTTHLPIKRISNFVIREKVLKVINLTREVMEAYFGIRNPRIGVSGLNPHAGESGVFGQEEIKEIIPAIKEAKENGINVTGPISPDIIFVKAKKKDFDVVVAMYHDQALIPIKMLDFRRAVNLTIGLPFIRTSVDHGVAYDIAGKGTADYHSMVEAIKLAARLSSRSTLTKKTE